MQHNLILSNDLIIDAVSMTASFTSTAQDISSGRSYCVQAVWSGATSAGTSDILNIQASLDGTNWTTVSSTATNATSGTILLNVEFPAYPYVRAAFTRSAAAAGTMSIRLAKKI